LATYNPLQEKRERERERDGGRERDDYILHYDDKNVLRKGISTL